MKAPKSICIVITVLLILLSSTASFAAGGYSGYEGGIAARQPLYGTNITKINYDYQEVSFLTGKPIVFKGTLTVTKKQNKGTVTGTYAYKLSNLDYTATLSRTLEYTTTLSTKDNGQSVETTALSKKPVETIKIDKNTYTLQSYDFTKTSIIDSKPAINYYAGNLHGTKNYTYVIGDSTGTAGSTTKTGTTSTNTITVEETGEFYGYDQYWGTTEVQTLSYIINNEQKSGTTSDKWGGTANVKLSTTSTKQLKYVANKPNQISFNGGYVETQHDESILEYQTKLPMFDSKGVSTDSVIDTEKSIKVETFPSEARLYVPILNQLKGHWAEDDIRQLYSLEVLKGNDTLYNPEQYITRAEFAADLSRAAREVPQDPSLTTKTIVRAKSKTAVKSPYIDVSTDNLYFSQIDNLVKRNIMIGSSYNKFYPGEKLVFCDVVTAFIKALGLESLAPNPQPASLFKDNDQIPEYARKAAFVAEKIGLVSADSKGNFNPLQKVTKAKEAQLLNSFINYMREGIRSDYREKIVNY